MLHTIEQVKEQLLLRGGWSVRFCGKRQFTAQDGMLWCVTHTATFGGQPGFPGHRITNQTLGEFHTINPWGLTMSRRAWRFAPAEVRRAFELAKESGLPINRFEIGIDGTLIFGIGEPPKKDGGKPDALNEWDDVA